eukprot:m.145829 g.145829  ORF g.145829 m.145829 type:complete len:55 (+) comp30455_c0_seq3:1683-1847(+)
MQYNHNEQNIFTNITNSSNSNSRHSIVVGYLNHRHMLNVMTEGARLREDTDDGS